MLWCLSGSMAELESAEEARRGRRPAPRTSVGLRSQRLAVGNAARGAGGERPVPGDPVS